MTSRDRGLTSSRWQIAEQAWAVLLTAALTATLSCQDPPPPPPEPTAAADEEVPTLSLESFRWRFWGASPCPEGTSVAQEYTKDGFERWCERPDGTRHGPHTLWHRNGWRAWEIEEREGYRHGTEREWYESGTLRRQGEWDHSKQVGTQTWWSESGERIWQCRYQDGEEVGCFDPRKTDGSAGDGPAGNPTRSGPEPASEHEGAQ